MMRVAIYVRVSTQEQAKEGYSIGEQTDRLKAYASIHDWTVANVYTDAGHSGANMNRPALQDLIHDINNHMIDKVVVYKLDRLSRSQKDTLTLIEDVMLANNCDFESLTEKFDTATPFGKAMIGILAVFAQLEREQIKERLSMGMEARIKEGKWKGGAHVPFGYTYDADQDRLVINEANAAIVRKMFDDFNAGLPITTIANRLTDQGIRLNHGARISRPQTRYILKNKTYCGYLKMRDQWIKGLHEPIIDMDTFEKAQVVLDANYQKFKEANIRTGYSQISSNLGGILFCGQCGGKFFKANSGTKGYGIHYNYVCYSKNKRVKNMIKDPNCQNKTWRMEELDALVFAEIKKLAIDPSYLEKIRQKALPDDGTEMLEQQINQITKQLNRYLDLYGSGTYSLEDINAKAAPLAEQRIKLRAELENKKSQKILVSPKMAIEMAMSLDDALEHGTLADRRKIILTLIKKIVIDGDDITIHWNI